MISLYFMYFHSVGLGGAVVSWTFMKCRLYNIMVYADCFHEVVHLTVLIILLHALIV